MAFFIFYTLKLLHLTYLPCKIRNLQTTTCVATQPYVFISLAYSEQ